MFSVWNHIWNLCFKHGTLLSPNPSSAIPERYMLLGNKLAKLWHWSEINTQQTYHISCWRWRWCCCRWRRLVRYGDRRTTTRRQRQQRTAVGCHADMFVIVGYWDCSAAGIRRRRLGGSGLQWISIVGMWRQRLGVAGMRMNGMTGIRKVLCAAGGNELCQAAETGSRWTDRRWVISNGSRSETQPLGQFLQQPGNSTSSTRQRGRKRNQFFVCTV